MVLAGAILLRSTFYPIICPVFYLEKFGHDRAHLQKLPQVLRLFRKTL